MHFIVDTCASNSNQKNELSSVCERSSLPGFVVLFMPDCLGAWESVLEIVRDCEGGTYGLKVVLKGKCCV